MWQAVLLCELLDCSSKTNPEGKWSAGTAWPTCCAGSTTCMCWFVLPCARQAANVVVSDSGRKPSAWFLSLAMHPCDEQHCRRPKAVPLPMCSMQVCVYKASLVSMISLCAATSSRVFGLYFSTQGASFFSTKGSPFLLLVEGPAASTCMASAIMPCSRSYCTRVDSTVRKPYASASRLMIAMLCQKAQLLLQQIR